MAMFVPWLPVSPKHDVTDRTDGTADRHCVNDKEYFENKSILTFLQCQSITICRGILSSNKVLSLFMF